MLNSHLAVKFAAFEKEGEVFDLLAASVRPRELVDRVAALPRSKNVTKWLKKDAETVEGIAATTLDPEVLLTLAFKERRKGVIKAIAGNRLLPWEGAVALFEKDLRGDYGLLETLVGLRSPQEVFRLVDEHTTEADFRNTVTANHLVKALARIGSPEAFELAVERMENMPYKGPVLIELVNQSLFPGSRVSIERVIELLGSIEYGKNLNSSELLKWIHSGDAALQREALKIQSSFITGSLFRAALDGTGRLSVIEILEESILADHWGSFFKRTIDEAQRQGSTFLVDLETVEVFKRANISVGPRDDMLFTEEAALSLLEGRMNLGWGWQSVLRSIKSPEGVKTLLEDFSSERLSSSSFSFEPEQLLTAADAGASLKAVAGHALSLVNTRGFLAECQDGKHPRLMEIVAENADRLIDDRLASAMSLENIETLLERRVENGSKVTSAAFWGCALKRADLNRALRTRIITETGRDTWTTMAFVGGNPTNEGNLERGELIEAYEKMTPGKREEFQGFLRERLGHNVSNLVWIEDALDLANEVPWERIQTVVAKAVHQRMRDKFHDDSGLWQTALTLMPDWPGTINELIESAMAL